MTDRERLTALLMASAGDFISKNGALNCSKLADYLLEHGVIVLPCKVGDTVYSYCETFGVILPYFVESVIICYYDKNEIVYQYEANCHNSEEDELLDDMDFEIDDIGKTVFLTREEAERALKERENNG